MSHDCRVRDGYLRGAYEGDCDERTELAKGKGEAKGADTMSATLPRVGPTAKESIFGRAAPAWRVTSRRAKPMVQGST